MSVSWKYEKYAKYAVSMIIGNAIVGRLSTDNSRRPAILVVNSVVRATTILAAGLLGALTPPEGRGVGVFSVVVLLYLIFGLFFGISNPIRMALVNRHIPSARRATVLSVDSFLTRGAEWWGRPVSVTFPGAFPSRRHESSGALSCTWGTRCIGRLAGWRRKKAIPD